MDKEAAHNYLLSTAGEAEVIQLEDLARQGDINSVPTLDIAGIRLTGAVPVDQLRYYIMDAYRNPIKTEGVRDDR
jgi:predicted DsbA family dithiol-disulfide isomerase